MEIGISSNNPLWLKDAVVCLDLHVQICLEKVQNISQMVVNNDGRPMVQSVKHHHQNKSRFKDVHPKGSGEQYLQTITHLFGIKDWGMLIDQTVDG